MIRTIKVILIILVFFLGLLFFIQNNEVLSHKFTLTIDLYGTPLKWTSATEVPYYYPILIAFATGALLAAAYFFMDYTRFVYRYLDTARKLRRVTKTSDKEITRLQAQVKALTDEAEKNKKQLPAGDSAEQQAEAVISPEKES